MSNFEISINSAKYSREKIESVVKDMTVSNFSWEIQKINSEVRSRGLDPTIVVASIGAMGTIIGALIVGLFQLVSGKKDEKIVLRSSKGMAIEFPASLSPHELDEIIKKLNQLENDKYEILIL